MKSGADEERENIAEEQQDVQDQQVEKSDNADEFHAQENKSGDVSEARVEDDKETITLDKKEYDRLVDELEKQKKDYLYLYAEKDNLHKRFIKERSELARYGSQNVFVALLEIVDNFERAMSLEVDKNNIQPFVDGIKLINNLLRELLDKFSVKEIPCLKEPFDPVMHEALGTEPSSDIEEGCVSKVLIKPYKLHDKVIRTGHVIVVNNSEKNKADDGTRAGEDNKAGEVELEKTNKSEN